MRNGNRGQVLLLFLGALLALLGVAALGIDVGYMYTVRHELQRSTDAGALAGASAFFDGSWSDAAIRAIADARARAFTSKDKVAASTLSPGGEISVAFPSAERVRVDSLDARFFVTAILIQRETGGNLAEIIDKIAHVIRERFRIQGQLKIFTAQARMTGGILCLLPVGLALTIGILNPDYLKPLWFEKAGRFLIALALCMQIAGALVIRKIVRIKI